MEDQDTPSGEQDDEPRAGPGPKRRLPKMNASERAKYYRRRVHEYMERLEDADAVLAREVEGLALLRTVQQQLVALQVRGDARRLALAHVWAFMDARQYLRPHTLSDVQFEVQRVETRGDAQGAVVRLDTLARGIFAPDTVEKQLYPFVPGNARLLDKLLRTTMAFTSSFRFYFDHDGELVEETAETDYAAGLLAALQCSAAEVRQLLLALDAAATGDRNPEASDEPRSRPSLDFLLVDEDQPVPP